MPFCPKCKYEYRPGITKCPDCQEYLVDFLPEEKGAEDLDDYKNIDNWQPLARLTAQQYAEMVVAGLKDKGIPVVMISETGHFGYTGQLGIGSYRPIGGGYVILAPADRAEDADREAELMLGEEWVKAKLG